MAELESRYQRAYSGSVGFCAADIVAYGWQRGLALIQALIQKRQIEYSIGSNLPIEARD